MKTLGDVLREEARRRSREEGLKFTAAAQWMKAADFLDSQLSDVILARACRSDSVLGNGHEQAPWDAEGQSHIRSHWMGRGERFMRYLLLTIQGRTP